MVILKEYFGEMAWAAFFTVMSFGADYFEGRPSSPEAYALMFVFFAVAFCAQLAWRSKS